MNPRIRGVLIAGAALALIAGVGSTVATSSNAADQRYVTTTAGTGEVTQTYLATGEVTRKYSADATFGTTGTVKSVEVQAGDKVYAGETLAVLNRGELRLAVLEATTSVAEAEASLYAAQHPTSTSGGGGKTPSTSPAPNPGDTITIDPTVLAEASSRINLAVLDEANKCDPIFDLILPEPSATATPTSSATATATATATTTASSSPTASTSATATPTPTASATPTTSASGATAAPTATASGLSTVLDGDFTDEELQACADARAEVIAANANLQQLVTNLTTPKTGSGKASANSAAAASSSSGSNSSSSSSSTVSKAAVARAKANLLSAEQELTSAQDELAEATLVAPISGTVGEIGLAVGDSSSAGSITIEGAGNAVVTFELPLSTRQLVSKGQEVSVTPASGSEPLSGRITNISVLETSGDSPTYTTTAVVTDPEGLLASGSSQTVKLPVSSVSSVVRLPASAVTLTGTGTGTVETVDSAGAASATTVEVKTGVVGGGWVQITEGVEAGQLVVLADNTEEIPTNTNFGRGRSSSSSSASASAAASASGSTAASEPAAPGSESPQPSASASR